MFSFRRNGPYDGRDIFSFLAVFMLLWIPTFAAPVSNSTTMPSYIPAGVPDYAIKYAPLIYLHSKDTCLPSDIGAQLANTTPKEHLSPLAANMSLPALNLDNLNILNQYANGGVDVYLTSNTDVTKNPRYMFGLTPDASGRIVDGKTTAVIVVDKGNGVTDVFYMVFFAFNWGPAVMGQTMGNHVGDWEHVAIRFQDGVPKLVWLSQHSSGQTFKYEVLANRYNSGARPVAFSANGSHAMYAIVGIHDHTIEDLHKNTPGLVNDYCDTGKLFDPVASAYFYTWTDQATTNNTATSTIGTFTPYDPSHPTGWLYFTGHWGDDRYPTSDKRQKDILGLFYKFEAGPTGPAFKDLGRPNIWSGSNHQVFSKLAP